jgi:hypothetical protein
MMCQTRRAANSVSDFECVTWTCGRYFFFSVCGSLAVCIYVCMMLDSSRHSAHRHFGWRNSGAGAKHFCFRVCDETTETRRQHGVNISGGGHFGVRDDSKAPNSSCRGDTPMFRSGVTWTHLRHFLLVRICVMAVDVWLILHNSFPNISGRIE